MLFFSGQNIKYDKVHCEYFQVCYVQEIELLQAIQVIIGFLNAGTYHLFIKFHN